MSSKKLKRFLESFILEKKKKFNTNFLKGSFQKMCLYCAAEDLETLEHVFPRMKTNAFWFNLYLFKFGNTGKDFINSYKQDSKKMS